VLSTRSELFSIRSDVGGEFTAATLRETLGASLNAISVGPALLWPGVSTAEEYRFRQPRRRLPP